MCHISTSGVRILTSLAQYCAKEKWARIFIINKIAQMQVNRHSRTFTGIKS